jgi:hypothetical protein
MPDCGSYLCLTGPVKTNGPFQYVLRSFLQHGFGGIFLCARAV